jgi:glycosyltransferase involved in cell wall biosynthesis
VGEKLVSVVVPTRNRSRMLERLLASLARQSLDPSKFEVIVVDDGSSDDTPELLERIAPRIPLELRVLRQSSAGGAAAARNRGWREAYAPLVAFTDDDCVATPGWLSELLEFAADGDDLILQGRTELAPGDAEMVGPFSRVLEITEPNPYYATCNIAYPRGLLEKLDGFDESFRTVTGEDTDLGWRAQEAGAGYRFVPQAVINHAVVELGPIGKLRWAFRWSEAMQTVRRHPGLRRTFTWRVFWKRSHALLVLAIAGALVSRRFPPAVVLALPYLRALRARCLVEGYSPGYVPYLALYDLAELIAAARGAARYRVLVL